MIVIKCSAFKAASHCSDVDPRKSSASLSAICWHAKDFAMTAEVDSDAGETQLGSHDGLRCTHECANVFNNVLQCSYNHFQTLEECDACLIVCASGINFGTV